MLEPAIAHVEELEKNFAKLIYSKEYYYYTGYAHCCELPEIETRAGRYQWAIIDSNGKVVGYFAYCVDPSNDMVSNFGMYSFDRGNALIGKEVFQKMEELVRQYRRVEWRMIGGNPVQKSYDWFVRKHGGRVVKLNQVTKGPDGTYRDEFIYEILREQR